jgi:ComF family protein
MKLKALLRMLKVFLYPPKCLACGAVFQTSPHNLSVQNPLISQDKKKELTPFLFQNIASDFLCPSCNTGFTSVEPPYCVTCGTMLTSCGGENHECEKCIKKPPHYKTARAAGIYENALMSLIHSLKYKKDIQVAKPLGQILFDSLIRFFSEKEIDFAVPVPLHPKKFRARGFNQSYLLMRRWPDLTKSEYPALLNLHIKRNIVERVRNTPPQTGLDGKNRESNIKDAFRLKRPLTQTGVVGKRILVVDDVMTTGSTVNECAKTLKKGGAKEIHVLTLARTQY